MIKLTPQQEKFAQEIVKGKSQAEAYRIAYPKSKNWKESTLYSRASELMSDGKVSARVDELRAPVIAKAQITAEEVLNDLMELRDMCMGRKKVVKTVISNIDGAVVPMDVEHVMIDNAGAKGALELLGKHLKLFTDKHETLLAGGLKINVLTGVPTPDE